MSEYPIGPSGFPEWSSPDGQIRLIHGDCRDLMRELPENSVDAIVCDPPYGLEFMGKEWDRLEPNRNKQRWAGTDRKLIGDGQGKGGGFGDRMNEMPQYRPARNPKCKTCGHYKFSGKPCDCETPDWDRRAEEHSLAMQDWHYSWAVEAFRVLKPGGHLLAFGGTRTYHRLACAIEDAGFEIRDTLCWMHGQGFPKGLDVSKQIDKQAGAEREVVGDGVRFGSGSMRNRSRVEQGYRQTEVNPDGGMAAITAPATDAAKQWNGWNVALKPAFEPIVLARKPLSESNVAANVLRWGTGAINVGACRIGTGHDKAPPGACGLFSHIRDGKEFPGNGRAGEESADRRYDDNGGTNFAATPGPRGGSPQGRWPANVLLSHHPDCVCRGTKRVKGAVNNGSVSKPATRAYNPEGWSGVAAFDYADADGLEEVEAWDCHPDCPVRLLDEQAGIRTSGGTPKRRFADKTRSVFGTFQGNEAETGIGGSSGNVSRFFYQAKAGKRERWFYCRDCQAAYCETERAGHQHGHVNEQGKPDWSHVVAHPTVKPLDLIRYLERLVTPRGGTILDCFLGTGTGAVAARQEGFSFIGMEQDQEYLAIATARADELRKTELSRFPLLDAAERRTQRSLL